MRAHRALLATLVEHDPSRVSTLPRSFLSDIVPSLLEHDEVYLVEQITKQMNVIGEVAVPVVAAAAHRALGGHRVDDYCFLHEHLAAEWRPDADRIRLAHRDLLRRGNAAGVEQLAARTGVRPVIDERTARRAYGVLAAAGRPGAIDYVRQLSSVPVDLDPADLHHGAHTLLAAGRYEAMIELAKFGRQDVRLRADALAVAVRHAEDDQALDLLTRAAQAWASDGLLTGFAHQVERIVATGAYGDLPALIALFADADPAALPDTVWSRVAQVGTPPALRLVLRHHPGPDVRSALGDRARALAVEARDRELLYLASSRGGSGPYDDDVAALVEEALDQVDLDWLDFAADRLGALPSAPPDVVQLFLAQVELSRPEDMERAVRIVGIPLDRERGRHLLAVTEGDRAAVNRCASELAVDWTTVK